MTRTFFFPALAAVLFLCLFPIHAGEEEETAGTDAPPLTVDDIPVQIADARVGDWASYVTGTGNILRLTVVERWNEHGDDHLVVESGIRQRGKRTQPHLTEDQVSVKERTADMRDLGPDDFLHASSVLVKGQKIDCVVVNYHEDGELRRQSYFSHQVPVFGLVRGVTVEGNKRTTALRLQDFEFAGGDDTE